MILSPSYIPTCNWYPANTLFSIKFLILNAFILRIMLVDELQQVDLILLKIEFLECSLFIQFCCCDYDAGPRPRSQQLGSG
jgi:hypothetical protein